ncbi:MAG: DUF3102 domain-containing protein [Clostridia bacterium]|nr:DUF3102 domain-containing protein [Clostridia bacterium]
MENLIPQQNQQLSVRDIDTVTEEINVLTAQAKTMAIAYIIELGRRLKEAKTMLPHGEWANWLNDKVNYSQSTANNYMKIYEEFGSPDSALLGFMPNSQALEKLSYSKAIALLTLNKEDRAEFIEQNDIDSLSSREIQKLIKERDEERKRAENAEKEAQELLKYKKKAEDSEFKINSAEADLLKVQHEKKSLESKISSLENTLSAKEQQLQDMANNTAVDEDTMNELRAHAEEQALAKFKEQLEEAKKREEILLKEKLEAEATAQIAKAQIEELEKQVKLSDRNVSEFEAIFNRFQEDGDKLLSIIATVEKTDFEMAKKLLFAAKAVAKEIFAAKLGE